MSNQISQHGVLLNISDLGVLIIGKSGIGKSECAIELLTKKAYLIADDVVIIEKEDNSLVGRPPETIKNLIEIRGIGIINVKDIFGKTRIRAKSKIDLVVELIEFTNNHDYERLGYDKTYIELLNTKVPHMKIPVSPGRNLSTLIEIAVKKIIIES
ncbi:MAG: hypothetical protein ACJ0OP_05365 [Thermodesulfobacteriota bacterium]|nr:MAG: hypothetical protein EVA31_03485 [Candidatus Dadabacteria bacterium]